MKRKGFTLIELIVVMAIIGVLVLLAGPKYKEHSKESQLTKIKVDVKELENASLQYYMRYNDWPRLTDEPYTAQQIEDFGKEILDKTGEVVNLDKNGNYYDIDYSKVDNYIKLNEDSFKYILQNPVGSIFFIEGITEEGKNRVPLNPGLDKSYQVIWNLNDKNTNITLSEGGLKTTNITMSHSTVRATAGKTGGKWYWEVKVLEDPTNLKAVGVGVSDSTEIGITEGISSSKSIRYYNSDVTRLILGNNINNYTNTKINNGDVIGVLLDMDNKTIEFRNNGSFVAAESLSEFIIDKAYPILDLFDMSVITNFGGDSFIYGVPQGYKAYTVQ